MCDFCIELWTWWYNRFTLQLGMITVNVSTKSLLLYVKKCQLKKTLHYTSLMSQCVLKRKILRCQERHQEAYTVRNFSQRISEMFWHSCPQRFIWALDYIWKSHARMDKYLENFDKSWINNRLFFIWFSHFMLSSSKFTSYTSILPVHLLFKLIL